MSIFQAVILGIVQGITEFFPVSSSGHLVIVQSLFGMKEPQLAFDIFLHLGTLVSILIFFRKDILGLFKTDGKTLLGLVIASIPTFIMAVLFKEIVEKLFAAPTVVGYMLLVTGVVLILAALWDILYKRTVSKDISMWRCIVIGIAQGIALIPGISRSGATISAGILSGIDREKAFRFSFLLAIPAIAGASIFKAHKIASGLSARDAVPFLAGGITAMIVGLLAVKILKSIIISNRLYIFGIYCILAGYFTIIVIR